MKEQKSYYFFSQQAADHYASLNNNAWPGQGKISKNFINGIPYTEMRTDGIKEPSRKSWTDWKLVAEGEPGYKGVTTNGYW